MTVKRLPVTKVEGTTIRLVAMDCAVCGVIFGMTEDMEKRRRWDGAAFYCPNGHNLTYNGEKAQLARQNEQLKREIDAAWDDARRRREEAEAERRSHGATKGQLTRLRKRADAGVCPHCNRTFQQVARHMASKHQNALQVEESA